MVKIQLTEANEGYLNVKDNTVFPINFNAAEIRDVAKRAGVYSRTVQLEGSKENAKLMNHYFDVHVVANSATFDINIKQKCVVIQNGVNILTEMYLQLKEVKLVNEIVTSYEVEVKDALADLFTVIANSELTDIDFSEDNHILSASAVAATFGNTLATSNYKYHLTTNDDNEFSLLQFKPAIWAYRYWDRIHSMAGFEWEWANHDDEETRFDRQLIPCTRSAINAELAAQVQADLTVEFDKEITAVPTSGVSTVAQANALTLIFDTENTDPLNLFDPVTSIYTSNLTYPAGQSLIFTVTIELELVIINQEAELIEAVPIAAQTISGYDSYIIVRRNAVNLPIGVVGVPPQMNITSGQQLTSLQELIVDTGGSTVNCSTSGIQNGDLIKVQIGNVANRKLKWQKVSDGLPASVREFVRVKSASLTVKPNANNGYYAGSVVEMNKFIPDKAKQIDFVKDVIVMNNLWVAPDPNNPKKLIYTKRDDYLDAGEVVDWKDKICLDKEISIQFLPELTKKKKLFTYKEDKDTMNVAYKDATGEVYGQVRFTFDNEYVRDEDKIEIKFSPTPTHGTTFGAFVPAINGAEPKHNIRILVDGGVKACSPFKIYNSPTDFVEVTSGYPHVGHFDDPINPTFDLNFATCDYYFYPEILTFTKNNLFNLNWRRQMYQINNGKMLSSLFDINEFDIQTFKPNAKIWTYGEYWHVNKIADYNSNRAEGGGNYFTRVELIPIDTEAKIDFLTTSTGGQPIRPVKPVNPVSPVPGVGAGNPTTKPLTKWIKKVAGTLNSYLGGGVVEVVGKNNIILGNVKNALVVGNDLIVDKEGITTEQINVKGLTIDERGITGSTVNVIDAGDNIVIGRYSTSIINVIDAGDDQVRGLGGFSTTNIIDAGDDTN